MTFTVETVPPCSHRHHLMFRVVAIDGEEKKPIHRTMTVTPENAHRLAEQIAGCERCQRQYLGGEVGPEHEPSPLCRMGGKTPHCSCEACW